MNEAGIRLTLNRLVEEILGVQTPDILVHCVITMLCGIPVVGYFGVYKVVVYVRERPLE